MNRIINNAVNSLSKTPDETVLITAHMVLYSVGDLDPVEVATQKLFQGRDRVWVANQTQSRPELDDRVEIFGSRPECRSKIFRVATDHGSPPEYFS
jgi:hypothetical protein